MIFNCKDGKGAVDGDFTKIFFKKYNEIDTNKNIGWEIIDSYPMN
jgi:hypothetical protein